MAGKHEGAPPTAPVDGLLAKAVSLFEFLSRCQQVKSAPVRTTDTYKRDGSVTWFDSLPDHPAVRSVHGGGEPAPDAPLLVVDRVLHPSAPEPGDVLRAFLAGPVDQADAEPELRDLPRHVLPESAAGVDEELERVSLDDVPGLRGAYGEWIARWRSWARQELIDRPARDLYTSVFSTYLTVANHSEELELVLGLGLLAWQPDGHSAVSRHLFTVPAEIRFDEKSGRLVVQRPESLDPPAMELDMLDPGLIVNPSAVNDIRERANEFEHHPFAREDAGSLVQRLVHVLDAQGEYFDQDKTLASIAHPRAAFAPALILRKRSQQGLVAVFQAIIGQLQEVGEVPDGLLPLVDPDRQPSAECDTTPGGIVDVDNEPFLPLPVNEAQLQIIRKVDSSAQVLVQGPPGTGKTHTAAALLSHLLAQGKRVLVTAQTDRALIEVRGKLPHAIKPLSVSVVGSSRSDMSDLKFAVEQISSRASAHDPAQAQRDMDETLAAIDGLRRERSAVFRQLVDARERETTPYAVDGYEGTLAKIALDYQGESDKYGWIQTYVLVEAGSESPVTNEESLELLGHLRDEELQADQEEAQQRFVELPVLPSPAEFAEMVGSESAAVLASDSFGQFQQHEAYTAVSALPLVERNEFRLRLHEIAVEATELEHRQEPWMNAALADVRIGKASIWSDRANRVSTLIEEVRPHLKVVGSATDVTVGPGERGMLVALARALHGHLGNGGKLKVSPAGQPQIGALTNKLVKEARPLFEAVRVNHLPPTSPRDLEIFIAYMTADDLLNRLDKAWPADIIIPEEDTLDERLQWHVTEHSLLGRLLGLAGRLAEEERRLQAAGAPKPDWTDLGAVMAFAQIVDAATAQELVVARAQPLAALHTKLATEAQLSGTAPVIEALRDAVADRNARSFSVLHGRLERLHQARSQIVRREELLARLSRRAPGLAEALLAAPDEPTWDERLRSLGEAWSWAATGAWVSSQESVDVNRLQATLTHIEGSIRGKVEHLAATRAWNHAVSPGRLTGKAQADLAQYAQLVKGYGKGTGKYAVQKRGEIRRAMYRCRPAVPVWIMPIYRIAEQLLVEPNMFDVVIVDEASQAGPEAAFLQYLAPKIVVIGDDKQVSPAAVGIDQQQIIDLANQYLAHDPYKASWQDLKRSLFDEAVMRFGGRITLTEHRRCMPEIIGFSNRVAYEPEGVRLIPVRQYGADRLDPIKAVHVPDGYERGTTARVNSAEVDAVVAQIEQCLADPRYDGKTMGVISLLGSAQAKAIEKALLERLDPEEWRTRDLRCGDSAEFQGSERDVMFLSMVKAPEPGARIGALTQEMYVQRYNVAASRAKDQMWVFHSVTLSDLGNPDDMRFALLDYIYGVINQSQANDGPAMGTVPDDVRVEPFDSLFEQRVFNKIVDRGYVVVPQFEASGYSIDLVVIGARGRLAIECDGDAWHGPDAYERDLARQRDLERCGWQFFRIRESAYYVDPVGELDKLWASLRELGIYPSGWMDDEMAEQDLGGDAPADAPLLTADVADIEQRERFVPDRGRSEDFAWSGAEVDSPTAMAEPSRTGSDTTGGVLANSWLPALWSAGTWLSGHQNAARHAVGGPVRRLTAWIEDDRNPAPGPTEIALIEGHLDWLGAQIERDPSNKFIADQASALVWALDQLGDLGVMSGRVASAEQTDAADRQEVASDPVTRLPETRVGYLRPAPSSALAPYEVSTLRVPTVLSGLHNDVRQGILQIVGVEGPVMGSRLQHAYVRASGQVRVGKQIASELNRYITMLVKSGELIADNPMGESGVKPRTYRLPTQPVIRVRDLGPRTLDEVPPSELADLMSSTAAGLPAGWDDREALYRTVLARLGLVRMTTGVASKLDVARGLAEGSSEGNDF